MTTINAYEENWVRAPDGAISGVCLGLSRKFGIQVGLVRFLFALSVIFGGWGLITYLILTLSLPKAEDLRASQRDLIFGVCLRIAEKYRWDLGLVRSLTCYFAIFSFGATLLVYIALNFMLPRSLSNPQEKIIHL